MATIAKSAEDPAEEKDQTVQPHGWLGYFIGWMMGLLNRKLNRITVQQLELDVDDAVLEIGCGAGLAIRDIFAKSLCHRVAGIDPSSEMIEQAALLNAAQLQAGQLALCQGKVEVLPWSDNCFTKVFAISNFHIWSSRLAGLKEISRVLRPGGSLTLCLRMARENPRWFDQPGITKQELEDDLKMLGAAGFEQIEQRIFPLHQPVVLLNASNQPTQRKFQAE